MTQPSLFDTPEPRDRLPYQRHSPTSREAAESAAPSAGTQRRAVFDALEAQPEGLTDEEIQTLLGMNPNTQRPRRGELVTAGKVRDSGRVRKTASGRNAVVWELVHSPVIRP